MREKRIAIFGANNEAVEYALGMLHYSACVIVATNGKKIHWDKKHARWLAEYEIPVERKRVGEVEQRKRQILALKFVGGKRVEIDYIFTTRGDIFHTSLAEKLGAKLDGEGQIKVDSCMRTTVPGIRTPPVGHAGQLPDDHRRGAGRRGRTGDQSRFI